MGLDLLASNPVFCHAIDHMDRTLHRLPDGPDWSLSEELQRPAKSSRISSSAFSQPLCTALQIALVDSLRALGIRPHAVVGHSSGEIAAAYAAGRLVMDEAIATAYYRGVVSAQATRPGGMAAVGLSRDDARGYLEEGVVI